MGGQGGDFLQGDVHGGVGDLIVQRTELPGVAFQFILHIGKLALDLQQVGSGLGLGGQGVQPIPLVFQRGDPRFGVDVAGGHVLGALVQAQHAAALPGLFQKGAVVFGRDPHRAVQPPVPVLGGTVHLAVLQPGAVGVHGRLQRIAGGVEVGGFQAQVGVVDALLGAFRGGSVPDRQGAPGPALGRFLGIGDVLCGDGGTAGGRLAGSAAAGEQGGGQRQGRQAGNTLFHGRLLSRAGTAPRPGKRAFFHYIIQKRPCGLQLAYKKGRIRADAALRSYSALRPSGFSSSLSANAAAAYPAASSVPNCLPSFLAWGSTVTSYSARRASAFCSTAAKSASGR